MESDKSKKVSFENATTIRAINSRAAEMADDLVQEFGIDMRLFKAFVVRSHGKTFASFRKKKLGIDSQVRKMVEKFLGIGDGVSVDTLLGELDTL